MIDRSLPAHGGVVHAARSEGASAVSTSEGLQGAAVPALLLPHVRLRDGSAGHPPPHGWSGGVAVAAERRAEHRLAEGHSGVPQRQPASGKSTTRRLHVKPVFCETVIAVALCTFSYDSIISLRYEIKLLYYT